MVNDLILDECLNDIRVGRATLEECLSKYPDQAQELAPLLKIALAIRQAAEIAPTSEFQQATRAQLIALAHEPIRRKPLWQIFPWFAKPQLKLAAIALAIGIALLGVTGGAVAASSDSLPGTMLYPIKRASEQAQLFFATDAASQANVHLQIANDRLEETAALSQLGQDELAQQTIDEYNAEVDRTLEIIGSQPNEKLASVELLTNRLLNQQEKLQKIKGPIQNHGAVERALSRSKKALKQLESMYSLEPTEQPTTSTQQLIPATPTIIPTREILQSPTDTRPAVQPSMPSIELPTQVPNDKGKPSDVPKPPAVDPPGKGKPSDVSKSPVVDPPGKGKPSDVPKLTPLPNGHP